MKDLEAIEKTVQLVINEACNLSCVYCYGKAKSDKTMPVELAKDILSKHLMDTDPAIRLIVIDFCGGEPLIDFQNLTAIVDYVTSHSRKWHKPFSFSFTTNGTLFTSGIRDWLDNHPCVGFGISIDGTRTAHNLNRSNSYDKLSKHIPWMMNRCNKPSVKMTISDQTIPYLFDGVCHLHSLGFREVAANVPYENIWGADLNASVLAFSQQLNKLVYFYYENRPFESLNLLKLPIDMIEWPLYDNGDVEGQGRFFPRWCGSGDPMICYDIDGVPYPCHRFTPFSTTRSLVYTGAAKLPLKLTSDIDPKGVKCASCPFLPACPSCCANNWETNGDVDHRTDFHCKFILMQIRATAKLQCLRLAREIEECKRQANLANIDSLLAQFRHALFVMQGTGDSPLVDESNEGIGVEAFGKGVSGLTHGKYGHR